MRIDFLKGSKFTVYAVGEADGSCAVKTFFAELATAGNSDSDQLIRRLQGLADGVRLRQEQAHPLDDGFYVVKSSGMSRLIWFYDPTERAIMICTHCFRKPASDNYTDEQKRASHIRASYFAHQEKLQASQAEQSNPKQKPGGGPKKKK